MTEDCIPSVQHTKITKNISAFELNIMFTSSIYKFGRLVQQILHGAAKLGIRAEILAQFCICEGI